MKFKIGDEVQIITHYLVETRDGHVDVFERRCRVEKPERGGAVVTMYNAPVGYSKFFFFDEEIRLCKGSVKNKPLEE